MLGYNDAHHDRIAIDRLSVSRCLSFLIAPLLVVAGFPVYGVVRGFFGVASALAFLLVGLALVLVLIPRKLVWFANREAPLCRARSCCGRRR